MPLNCSFVEDVVVPVELIYASPSGGQCYTFSTLDDLEAHLSSPENKDYTCLTISICQRNSWRPLQITQVMLDRIVAHHGLDSSFWDLPSCFYSRNDHVEEVFCMPYTQTPNDAGVEISYTIRYPELKEKNKSWVIRQSGIYHRFNAKTGQSLYILLSPMPNSKAHQWAKESCLGDSEKMIEQNPFWLHWALFSRYTPAWRQYIASREREFLEIRNKTFSTYIDNINEPLGVGYNSLSTLVSLENHFLQIPTILSQTTEVLDELLSLTDLQLSQSQSSLSIEIGSVPIAHLKCHRRQCTGYSRTATYLLQRTQATVQLLAETLSLRDQIIAKKQNETTLRLNKSVAFITTLTLFYLPPSFVSGFFGMNFFTMDEEHSRIVATSMIWIYVVTAVLLTAATFLFYTWLLVHEKPASPAQTDKSKVRYAIRGLWTGALVRKPSQLVTEDDVELQVARTNARSTWSTAG